MENSIVNNKNLAFNNLVTCIYVPAIIFVLYYTGNLYNIGNETFRLEFVLALAEILKFLKCYLIQRRYVKRTESRKSKIPNFFKSVFTLMLMVAIYYTTAVLFGAPVFSEQYETFSFALILTSLTVLPCCLFLGADSVPVLFTSLTAFEGSEVYQKFLFNIRLTVFGAWLGAVLIPLDWNKPYQEWPIPCCLGAIGGCFISNLILFLLYSFHVPPKKTGKYYL